MIACSFPKLIHPLEWNGAWNIHLWEDHSTKLSKLLRVLDISNPSLAAESNALPNACLTILSSSVHSSWMLRGIFKDLASLKSPWPKAILPHG